MREPWDQRLDEPSKEYRLFVWWRDQVPRPPPSDCVLAQQYDWSTRAAAWDAHRTVPASGDERIDATIRALTETAFLQARRLLDRTRTEPGFELDPKSLTAMTNALVSMQIKVIEYRRSLGEQSGSTGEANAFADRLTGEQQQELLLLLEKAGV